MQRPSINLVSKPACVLACAVAVAYAGSAGAGVTIKGPADTSFSIGAGIRMSYTAGEDENDSDFNIDSTRIFTSGQITKNISAVLNFEKEDDDSIRVMDAIGQFSFSKALNVWVGRQLPAVDRANLAGPYYATSWFYPGKVSNNPAIAVGRDDGVQVWGNLFNDKFKYVVGAFEGNNRDDDPGGSESLAFTGRFTYAIMGSEAGSVYYENTTYHGSQDLLVLAFGFQYQNDGVGAGLDTDDYFSWTVDVLYESKLTATTGSLTLEAAYYDYNYDLVGPGVAEPGDGFLAGVAYLFPQVVGIGRFQPYVRYQSRDYELSDTDVDRWEFGVNYVMKGHDARISASWVSQSGDTPADEDDFFVIGLQLQY